ncbi:hypothetical protein [Kitasatospora sp. CB01950]|uniref:hypothetical protein n=1 Tax=Kitasatospora sp. CB01950 TaxID=1703930 RepID=UPI0013019248|nr:hypothetical protein [Kitasatospora sp. CB01950]
MSTDRTPEDSNAETEAVLSLQEAPAVGDDVEAHAVSNTSVAMCPTTPTNPTHPTLS